MLVLYIVWRRWRKCPTVVAPVEIGNKSSVLENPKLPGPTCILKSRSHNQSSMLPWALTATLKGIVSAPAP